LDILQQTELLLVIFKHYKYLFTHTDFKLENLFYKIENGKVIIYLGDFDKSSIYYHNIRFCPSSAHIISDKNPIYSLIYTDDYTHNYNVIFNKYNFNTGNEHVYKLSRWNESIIYAIGRNIEPEQLYMRYSFLPYYMSFDICSLFVSIVNSGKLQDYTKYPGICTFMDNYIYGKHLSRTTGDSRTGISNIFQIFKDRQLNTSDFGLLINEMILRNIGNDTRELFLFKNKNIYKNYVHISKLIVNNKICLTLPYVPLFTLIGNTKYTYGRINMIETKRVYEEHGQSYSIGMTDEDYKIDYSYDWVDNASFCPKFIVKTNRYSKSIHSTYASLTSPGVYEYMNANYLDIIYFIDYFNKITNNNYYDIPKLSNILDELTKMPINIINIIDSKYIFMKIMINDIKERKISDEIRERKISDEIREKSLSFELVEEDE